MGHTTGSVKKPSYSFSYFVFFFPWVLVRSICLLQKQKTFLLYLSRFGWILGLETKETFMRKHNSSTVFHFLKSVIRTPSISEPMPWNMVFVSTSQKFVLVAICLDETGRPE